MDFVIDTQKLAKLVGAAESDCFWDVDGEDVRGFGIAFSRLLECIREARRKPEEGWNLADNAYLVRIFIGLASVVREDFQQEADHIRRIIHETMEQPLIEILDGGDKLPESETRNWFLSKVEKLYKTIFPMGEFLKIRIGRVNNVITTIDGNQESGK